MGYSPVADVILAFVLLSPCVAQSNRQFKWSFRDKSLSELPTCSPLPIVVESFDTFTENTSGVPPYYMLSYPVGGVPITSLLGSDVNNLKWTVTHPLDSEVIMSVVDSTGGSGGIPANPLRVVAGASTTCIETVNNVDPFVVRANVSGSLSQCEPWGVVVSGGFPPYVVMLGETNSPVPTNYTPLSGGTITFAKRVDLGGELIVAVADSLGRWATGTPAIHLEDSTDEICEPALPFTPSATPSDTPSATPSDTPSATPSDTPSVTPSDTPSPTSGMPATIQVEVSFQSPQIPVLAMPTPTSTPGATSGQVLPNFMTTLTLSGLPTQSSLPSFSADLSGSLQPSPSVSSFAFLSASGSPSPPFPHSPVTSSFSSSPTAAERPSALNTRRTNRALTLGLAIPLAVILAVGCGGLGCWLYAKRKRLQQQRSGYQLPAPFFAMSEGPGGYRDAAIHSPVRALTARRDIETNDREELNNGVSSPPSGL